MTDTGLYLSAPHDCPYLPEQTAMTLVVDPQIPVEQPLLELSMRHGFRRSGAMIYRPHCPSCSRCESVRIPVRDFAPNRSQKRAWQRNRDLSIQQRAAEFNEEHFELYTRYQRIRHPGSPMNNADPDHYLNFLKGPSGVTSFYEFRLHQALVAVAVVDQLSDALSAVYTFYEPDCAGRSLGVFTVLWEIDQAKRQDLKWVYLGYWIKQCPKMAYKTNFRPAEGFRGGAWRRLTTSAVALPIHPIAAS